MSTDKVKIAELANQAHNNKREYFISTINLFLTICIGLITFIFSSFKDFPIDFHYIIFLRIGLFVISLSVLVGILASYSQYKHFIYIAQILSYTAANMETGGSYKNVGKWRKRVKWLFDIQVLSMLIGLIIIAIYYLLTLHIM